VVIEGEPIELEPFEYNVLFTRPLNRFDVEDREYLKGQPAPGPTETYVGVFIKVKNKDDVAHEIPENFDMVDTADGRYEPLKQSNVDTGMGVERTICMMNGCQTRQASGCCSMRRTTRTSVTSPLYSTAAPDGAAAAALFLARAAKPGAASSATTTQRIRIRQGCTGRGKVTGSAPTVRPRRGVRIGW
jgi:hypothetical protein